MTFNGCKMIYDHVDAIRDPLKQDLALEFCKKQNKVTSILTQTHIKHDRIRHIKNNWLSPNFFSPGEFTQKECFFYFICVLKVSLRLILIQREGLFPLRLIPLTIESSVHLPSGYSTRAQLARGENKNVGNGNEITLGDLLLWIKLTGIVKIKHKNFICGIPVMPCQNSSWIMGLGIYGEWRAQIPLSSPVTIGPLARIQDRQGLYWYLYWYKNC